MNEYVKTNMKIDTTLLTKQRALIGALIGSLNCGRLGFAITSDKDTLIGIQGILDALADSANFTPPADYTTITDFVEIVVQGWDHTELINSAESSLYDFWNSPEGREDYEARKSEYEDEGEGEDEGEDGYDGPECPGCGNPGKCKGCEYNNN